MFHSDAFPKLKSRWSKLIRIPPPGPEAHPTNGEREFSLADLRGARLSDDNRDGSFHEPRTKKHTPHAKASPSPPLKLTASGRSSPFRSPPPASARAASVIVAQRFSPSHRNVLPSWFHDIWTFRVVRLSPSSVAGGRPKRARIPASFFGVSPERLLTSSRFTAGCTACNSVSSAHQARTRRSRV